MEHILFKTIGKTDAEVAEIRQKAEDVLKKAKSGANFEDLAKKYSEDDATKPKGGDLGWIVEGQTVPEFQQAAFTLPKGAISDLVKTQYGFHIIKVLDHEQAHTKTFEEVRSTIEPTVLDETVSAKANDISEKMAAAIRQSNHQSLDDLAKKFNLTIGRNCPPFPPRSRVGVREFSGTAHDAFPASPGRTKPADPDSPGFRRFSLPRTSRPGTRARLPKSATEVLADYQQEKSVELAKAKADDFAKSRKAASRSTRLPSPSVLRLRHSDPLSRTGSDSGRWLRPID